MRQTRKKKRSLRRVMWLGAALIIIIVAALGWSLGSRRAAVDDAATVTEDTVVHVMLMGVDRRADDVGRSDTLMVASIDMDKERAALLSVPRDTRVPLNGGYEKINHAYAYGGHELTQASVESLLGLKIDHYILIDTKAFSRIVDAIGGVDIDVEKRMYYEDPWDDNGGLVIDLYPGEQHLDGDHAIQYVRYRDGEGDIGRIARQQKFMRAVLAELITPEVLPRLPKLIGEIASALETDMSVPELLSFAKDLKNLHANGLSAQMVPGRPAYIEDVSYWIPDITDTRELLVSELGLTLSDAAREKAEADEADYMAALPAGLELSDEVTSTPASSANAAATAEEKTDDKQDAPAATPSDPSDITVMVINDSGINGAGAEVADTLKRKGFKISAVETGHTSSREQTIIQTSAQNTEVFYGMPFACIIMDGGTANQAVVHIGLDYSKE